MASGLANKLTGQIGEYLACAELGRRGYIATTFTGNVPEYDLLVFDRAATEKTRLENIINLKAMLR